MPERDRSGHSGIEPMSDGATTSDERWVFETSRWFRIRLATGSLFGLAVLASSLLWAGLPGLAFVAIYVGLWLLIQSRIGLRRVTVSSSGDVVVERLLGRMRLRVGTHSTLGRVSWAKSRVAVLSGESGTSVLLDRQAIDFAAFSLLLATRLGVTDVAT